MIMGKVLFYLSQRSYYAVGELMHQFYRIIMSIKKLLLKRMIPYGI